jgi:hypothetical protein
MGSGAGGLGALGSVAALGLSCVVLLCRVPAFIKDQGPSKVPSRCKVQAQCKVPAAAGGTRARACTSVAHAAGGAAAALRHPLRALRAPTQPTHIIPHRGGAYRYILLAIRTATVVCEV